jgi:hypothetical protein
VSVFWVISVELGHLSRVHTFMDREMRARTRFVIGQEDESRLETSQQNAKSKIGCKGAVITWRTVHEAETGSVSPRETWSLVGGVGQEPVSRALGIMLHIEIPFHHLKIPGLLVVITSSMR